LTWSRWRGSRGTVPCRLLSRMSVPEPMQSSGLLLRSVQQNINRLMTGENSQVGTNPGTAKENQKQILLQTVGAKGGTRTPTPYGARSYVEAFSGRERSGSLLPKSRAKSRDLLEKVWCERGDSNPHALRRQILSLVRLPIPPLSHNHDYIKSLHHVSATAVDGGMRRATTGRLQ
jgi:hypothetical protein